MIVHPEIEKYLEGFRADRSEALLEMEEKAMKENFPIIGPDVGHLLYLLAKISNAESVLELGSGFGYSALFFSRALPASGKIVCTDMDEDNKALAEHYFLRAGISGKTEFILGDALKTAVELKEEFDIVYNDIDKEYYPRTIDVAWERLKRGGMFITDNTLWYGRVTEKIPPDEATVGVNEFNRMLKADPRFEYSILPIRDGLTLAVKK